MPEKVECSHQDVSHHSHISTNDGASADTIPDTTPVASESQNGPTESVTSPRDNDSDIPCPFDSQSSLDEENGDGPRRRPLRTRIQETLHLKRKYPDGYESGRINQIIRSLNQYPPGYAKIAAVEDLDPDFAIYRKFGYLHNYALLYLQDELTEIQDDLERFDRWEFSDGSPTQLISRRKGNTSDGSRRKELVDKLHSKLAQYDDALLRLQKIQAIKRPTERAQRNMYNLISNTQSLVKDEADWIREGPDLAALGQGNEHGWLNTFLEDVLNTMSRKVTMAIFSSSEQRIKTGDEELDLLSANRFDILLRIVLTIIAAILLLVPVFVLFRLQPTSQEEFQRKSTYQILTVFLFTLAFSASCSIFTQAKRQEVFTATAAYSAVLVVFLGNASNVMMSQKPG